DGTYVLILRGGNSGGPVAYRFQVNDVSDAPVAAAGFNVVHSGTLASGDQATFTFTAPAGLPVYFDSLSPSPLHVEGRDPTGAVVLSMNAGSNQALLGLPRSGTYTVTVSGSGGSYSFRL